MTECTTATTKVDLTKVKPYGDTMNDGKVEMAFTLPVPYGEEAEETAKQLVKKMGFDEPNVTYYHELCPLRTQTLLWHGVSSSCQCPHRELRA